jgi:protein TonB
MRFYTVAVSIVVHAALLVVLVAVPIVASDWMPDIREVPGFIRADAAELPEPPPPPRAHAPNRASREVVSDAAPTAAPDRIEPETPATVTALSRDDLPGIEGGVPGGMPLGDLPAPVPPPPAVSVPLRPGGDIRVPQKIRHVAPVYPQLAQSVRKQGVVMLDAVIGEDGRVRNVRVIQSIPLLDQAAIDAVRQWVFTPTLLNGHPVPVVMTVTVSFELK